MWLYPEVSRRKRYILRNRWLKFPALSEVWYLCHSRISSGGFVLGFSSGPFYRAYCCFLCAPAPKFPFCWIIFSWSRSAFGWLLLSHSRPCIPGLFSKVRFTPRSISWYCLFSGIWFWISCWKYFLFTTSSTNQCFRKVLWSTSCIKRVIRTISTSRYGQRFTRCSPGCFNRSFRISENQVFAVFQGWGIDFENSLNALHFFKPVLEAVGEGLGKFTLYHDQVIDILQLFQ